MIQFKPSCNTLVLRFIKISNKVQNLSELIWIAAIRSYQLLTIAVLIGVFENILICLGFHSLKITVSFIRVALNIILAE